MASKDQYGIAAHRHWRDAELLARSGHARQNADQLYGLAAECGLKRGLQQLGLSSSSGPARHQRVHLPEIWEEFALSCHTRLHARALHAVPSENAFADWSINDRYRGPFEPDLMRHREAAQTVLQMLEQLQLDLGAA